MSSVVLYMFQFFAPCTSVIFQFSFPTDRFGMLPLEEPAALLSEFLERFQSLCHLDLQLPSLRPEDLKTMVGFSWLASSGLQLSPVFTREAFLLMRGGFPLV